MTTAVMATYARAEIEVDRGEGVYLFTRDGRRFLDFGAGVAVTALGHCHPHLVSALTEQAGRLWHTSNLYRIPGQERLAARLVEHSFADRVFFTNSGVEAWECGVKVARRYFHHKGQPERWRVITIGGAFHGRTLAAISAAKQAKLLEGFGPEVPGFDLVAPGDLDAVRAAITPETAAINVEPIQGEGGIYVMSDDYMRGLRAIADETGCLLYLDEIQSGMGRTGRLFAHEWSGIRPDILCAAKGIGGGFPLGACLATEEAAAGMTAGSHGSTYGGNPLAMAVGNALLDVVSEPGFLDHVETVGAYLKARLEALYQRHSGIIAEVRGKGLMLGLKMAEGRSNADLINAARDHGLLLIAAGDNVVRVLPPLIITNDDVDAAMECLDAACDDLAGRDS